MLTKIKLLLSITGNEKDDLLKVLLDQVIDYVISYTHNPDSICCLENTIVSMVVFNYNRLGTEGLNSEGYSGVSFNYASDYPETILKALKAHKKVGVIRD